jgi:hypothetical protein
MTRMVEGVPARRCRNPRCAAGRQFKQGLGRLGRRVIGQLEQRILVGRADVGQPFCGHPVPEQLVVADVGEERPCRLQRQLGLPMDRPPQLLHRLANLHQLRGARLRMGFQLAALGPGVGSVVMIDVAKQQAVGVSMHDDPDVAADPDRPEILVPRPFELVTAHGGIGRVELQVERRRLDEFLLLASQARQTVGESGGDAKFHSYRRLSFSFSSDSSSAGMSSRMMLHSVSLSIPR